MPFITRKEEEVVKSVTGGTTGSRLSMGLAATITNLAGLTAGTGVTRN